MRLSNIILGAALLFFVGCAAKQPVLDTSADAELSFDGLSPMQDTNVDILWVKPDFDLSGYTKLWIQGAGVQYRPVKPVSRARSSYASEFPVTEQQKTRLVEIVQDEFTKALTGLQRYDIVSEAGPDVLILRGALLDVVSHVPPVQPGRTDFYIDSVADATLLIELVDSQSGTTLIRVADRKAAAQHGYTAKSNVVTNSTEVRRLVKSWAGLLASRLEYVSDLNSMGAK